MNTVEIKKLGEYYKEILKLKDEYDLRGKEEIPSFLEFIKTNSELETSCREFSEAINWLAEDEESLNYNINLEQEKGN